jgi:hypothetical protein
LQRLLPHLLAQLHQQLINLWLLDGSSASTLAHIHLLCPRRGSSKRLLRQAAEQGKHSFNHPCHKQHFKEPDDVLS